MILERDAASWISHKKICIATRTPLPAQEHLMAERKRRENLCQLFITLSKAVPGLNKLDRASLLEAAIDYLRALQERVRVLEEEEIQKSSMDALNNDSCSHKESSINNRGFTSELAAPEIEGRISDKHVLIKIFCGKQMGLMPRIMPSGGAALDINILAGMQSEFRGMVKDIVDHLQTVFLNPRDRAQEADHL